MRTLSLFVRSWAIGLTAWVGVCARDVSIVYAQTVVDTDCSANLDQPDTTYRLSGNVSGGCIITANNITIDGQSLYTIGHVSTNATTSADFAIQDVTVEGDVGTYTFMYDIGDITIMNSVVGGNVWSDSQYGSTGDIYITDSLIEGHIRNVTNGAGTTGDITITDSEIRGYVDVWDTSNEGNITIINSTIDGNGGKAFGGSSFSVGGHTPVGPTHKKPHCTISDSVVVNPSITRCTTLTITDNPPELTINPREVSIRFEDNFNPFNGVKAQDAKDGDISDNVMIIGEVGEEDGIYELTYSVADSGTILYNLFDSATTTISPNTRTGGRTVTRHNSFSESTKVAAHKANKEKKAKVDAQDTLPVAITATVETLKTALAQPIATNDPEALKTLINLVQQLITVLLQLMLLQQER